MIVIKFINKYIKTILIAILILVFFISTSFTTGLDLWNDDSYLIDHDNAVLKKGFASIEQLKSVYPNNLTPSEFIKVFNLSEAQKEGNYGEGETIAILAGDGNFDLNAYKKFCTTFAKQYPDLLDGVDPAVINGSIKTATKNNDVNGETALDVEWAHVVAPKAKLIIINVSSNNLKDLKKIFKQYHVTVVSSSIDNITTQELIREPFWFNSKKIKQDLLKPESLQWIASNYPMFVASGDYGQHLVSAVIANNAVLVGGINVSSYQNIYNLKNYTIWNNEGFGNAVNVALAADYQKQVLHQDSMWRQVPDVVWLADYPYVSVYSKNGWFGVDGTSVAAPLFSALWSLADNAHKNVTGTSLPSNANQVLYSLAKNHPDSFRKNIVKNDSDKWQAIKWGLGFPNPKAFVKNLSTFTAKMEPYTYSNLIVARIPFDISYGLTVVSYVYAGILVLSLLLVEIIKRLKKFSEEKRFTRFFLKLDELIKDKKMILWFYKIFLVENFIDYVVLLTNQITIQFKTFLNPGELIRFHILQPNRIFIFSLICVAVVIISFKIIKLIDYSYDMVTRRKIRKRQITPHKIENVM